MNDIANILNIKFFIFLLSFNFLCIYLGINSSGLNDADWWLFWAADLKNYFTNDYQNITCKIITTDVKEIISCLTLSRYYPNLEVLNNLNLEVPGFRNLADMSYCQPIIHILLLKIINFFLFLKFENPYNSILFTNLIYLNLFIFILIYISRSTNKNFFTNNANTLKILLWIFSPPILVNSVISLYSDIFYFLPVLLSIYFFLKNRYILSGAIFCIALLYKPTVIFILPFFLINGLKSFIKFNFSIFISSLIIHLLVFAILGLNFFRYLAGIVYLLETQINFGINSHLSLIRVFWEPITRGWAYALTHFEILFNDHFFLKVYNYYFLSLFALSFPAVLIINKKIKNFEKKINLLILLIIFLVFSRPSAGNNHWLIIIPLLIYGSLKSNFFKYYFVTLFFFIGDLCVGLSRNTLPMQVYYFPYLKIEPKLLMFYGSVLLFFYLIYLFYLFQKKTFKNLKS